MSKINIFVSYRIDLDCIKIGTQSIFRPTLCGSTFIKDKTNKQDYLFDDDGENISNKRNSLCELTVQYWAWKNIDVDYYGLCHYRRYLAFNTPKKIVTNEYGHILCDFPTYSNQSKFGLLDDKLITNTIEGCDILTACPTPVNKIHTPKGIRYNLKDMWAAYDDVFIEKEILDYLLTLIKKHSPEYFESAQEYYSNNLHYGFNCFVMNKKAYNELCSFQFPILLELDSKLDTSNYSAYMKRTPGFAGEILYGIFIYHHNKINDFSIKNTPIVFFEETRSSYKGVKLFWLITKNRINRLCDFYLLPRGTKRRKFVKNIAIFLGLKSN